MSTHGWTHLPYYSHTPVHTYTRTPPTHLFGCSDGLLTDVGADRTEHRPPVCLLLHKTGSNPRAITCFPFEPPVGRHSVLLVFVYVHGGHYCSTCRHYATCRLRGKSRWAGEGTLKHTTWEKWEDCLVLEELSKEQLTSSPRHRLKQPITAPHFRDVTARRIPDGLSLTRCQWGWSRTSPPLIVVFLAVLYYKTNIAGSSMPTQLIHGCFYISYVLSLFIFSFSEGINDGI